MPNLWSQSKLSVPTEWLMTEKMSPAVGYHGKKVTTDKTNLKEPGFKRTY